MGKETKIGLSVIGVLMIIFSGVLYYRLSTGDEPLADATDQQSDDSKKTSAKPAATDPAAVKSKLIPGDADTPLRSNERNWAHATDDSETAPESAAQESADRPHARHLTATSDNPESSVDESTGPDSAQAELARGADPFAARRSVENTLAEAADAADEATIVQDTDPDDAATLEPAAADARNAADQLQPLPARASAQSGNTLRAQSEQEVAEEGDPAPTRAFGSRLNQPTLATGSAAQTRVAQASDQQPESARQPLRSRTAQPTTADDRYGNARDDESAEPEDLPRRANGDVAARGERDRQRDMQHDSQSDLDVDRPMSENRPGRLGSAAASRPKPARVAVPNGKYKVQPNDNYWTISEKVYGSGNFFKAIHEHNRVQHPESDSLSVGDVIEVLSEAELLKRYPALCPKPRAAAPARSLAVQTSAQQHLGGRVYVVEQGDTLFDIARHELGKASRWAEIYDLNRDALGEDFDFLQPGTELVLPANKRETEVITRQIDESYRR